MNLFLKWKQPALFSLFCCFGLIVLASSSTKKNNSEPHPSLKINSLENKSVTEGEKGTPERGQFLLIYSYQGESIDPEIKVTRNGETVGSLSQLSTISSETLVDMQTDKGDQIGFSAEYGKDLVTGFLHESLASFVEGFWANVFSVNFYLQDEEGNLVEYLGTMSITFYLIPPLNGFELLAEPSSIAPGESSTLSLQAIEAPGVPVIIPDVTSVSLRTSLSGIRLGGFSLPAYGYRMVQGVTGQYASLTGTTLLYEADADSSLLVGESEIVSVLAYSPYNVLINGGAVVEVSVEKDDEEEDINLVVSTEDESLRPQKTGGQISTQVTVQVRKDNEPASEFGVALKVTAVPNSGGHEHHENRSTGILEHTAGTTNENGIFTTTFTSSEVAGEEWVIASSSQTSSRDSAMVAIKVSDLIEFPEGSSYQLTGASDAHPSNHYIYNEAARDNLIDAAVSFSKASWNTTVDMHLDDMSLKWGGIFDLNSNWTNGRGHNSHRTGKDVDIQNLTIQDTTVTITHPVTGDERERTVRVADKDWLEQYKKLMNKKSWRLIDEEQTNPLRDPENDNPKLYWPHFRWNGD